MKRAVRATRLRATFVATASAGSLTLALAESAPGREPWPARGSLDSAAAEAMRISPDLPELKLRPALIARLRHAPHAYFRFVNPSFSQAVCRRFEGVRA